MLAKLVIIKQEKEQILKELARLQEENNRLKEEVQERKFGFDFIKNGKSDFGTKFYTGLPNYQTFVWLFSVCKNDLPTSKGLIPQDVLLLIWMKIRLNVTKQDLAYRFNISVFHISALVTKGLQTIAGCVQFLVRWPSKDVYYEHFQVYFAQDLLNEELL